jgi:hypothetical protein
MDNSHIIKVKCRCGYVLFKYCKVGTGRLVKCYIPRILEDYVGVQEMPLHSKPKCPQCNKDIGIIKFIKGMPTIKLNQGTIKPFRVS